MSTYTRHHMCVSVAGSLRSLDKDLRGLLTLDDGREATTHQTRQWLRIQQMKGRKVVPIGQPCEGFSYEIGCHGHPITQEEYETSRAHD
jgi:hypothetical protein